MNFTMPYYLRLLGILILVITATTFILITNRPRDGQKNTKLENFLSELIESKNYKQGEMVTVFITVNRPGFLIPPDSGTELARTEYASSTDNSNSSPLLYIIEARIKIDKLLQLSNDPAVVYITTQLVPPPSS